MTNQEIEKLYRHSQLKLGIVRALNRFKGSHYQNQIRFYFSSYADDQFIAAVEELIAENAIIRTTGKMGASILQLVISKEQNNG
jgi:hypothetical protein